MDEIKKHGTCYGYQQHRRRDEEPCPACRKAKADYQKKWYAEHGKDPHPAVRSHMIPAVLLAELYLNAPIDVQRKVEKQYDRKKLEHAVKLYDREG